MAEGKYDHTQVEKKWQEIWEKHEAFKAPDNPGSKKLYILDMFPYPSGAGLHVGHVEGYTATDIYSRYKRMQGYNVLHPMGWDAFGLPAENYAIKTGIPPVKTTADAIDTFRRQIKSLGLSYDWSREVGTHTPEYYKWTQWFFLFLYKNGLAYKKKALVNWDPVDQTVLANEQVLPDGTAERSGAKVEKKELEQWFFKITDFADALVDDLDTVDWPDSTKINQKNWIGRSEGLIFTSPVKDTNLTIETFSAHFEAFYADTFVVIAPDHPFLPTLLEGLPDKNKILAAAKAMTDKRAAQGFAEKEPEGIFTGRYTADPVGNGDLPIWIANFALADYGTGIVKCSAHDERDVAFAKKYNIKLKEVLEPLLTQTTGSSAFHKDEPFVDHHGVIVLLKHWSEDKYLGLKWRDAPDWGTLLTGTIDPGMSAEDTARAEIGEETGYKNLKTVEKIGMVHGRYYHGPKKQNRIGHTPIFLVTLADGEQESIAADEAGRHELLWLSPGELEKFLTPESHQYALKKLLYNVPWTDTKNGILTEPAEFTGKIAGEHRDAIADYAVAKGFAQKKTTYRLRDWLISRQRYWGAPIPVVYDPEGTAHPVPEEHLPWMLPTDVEFRPTGTSPLGQSKELLERTEKIFGKGWRPEIDTMDTFVCSSWYYFRFADPHNDNEFAGKEKIKQWLPVDLYVGGAEHTVLHLMYARFFTKALQKSGLITFGEPFLKLRHQGTILAEDSRKMSKRWNNVINPDDVVAEFGADTLRLYEMFMGPLEAMKPWNSKSIVGARRFLDRVWKLKLGGEGSTLESLELRSNLDVLLHQTIKKVGEDIEALKLNTAISALMILLNEFEKLDAVPVDAYKIFLQLLAPLAPHIAHELAEQAGFVREDWEQWPTYDPAKIAAQVIKIGVQVNGKVRGSIELTTGATEAEALAAGRAAVGKWFTGPEKKAVYVPGRIVSFQI